MDPSAKPWYIPERDGNLLEYVASMPGGTEPHPLFRGSEYFEALKKAGLLVPGRSVIRVYQGHYIVTKDYQLRGADLPHMSGEPGIHDPIEVLDSRQWEAQHLDRTKLQVR